MFPDYNTRGQLIEDLSKYQFVATNCTGDSSYSLLGHIASDGMSLGCINMYTVRMFEEKERVCDNYILKLNPVQYGLYLTNYTDLFDRSTAKLLQLREYGRRNLEQIVWENPEDVYLDFNFNKDRDKNGKPYYSIEPISAISKDGLWDNPNLNAVIAYSPDGRYIEFIDRHQPDNDLLSIHRIEIIGCRLLSNKLQLIKSSDLVIYPEFQYCLVLHNPDKPHFYSCSLVGRHVLYPDRKVFEFAMGDTWFDFF